MLKISMLMLLLARPLACSASDLLFAGQVQVQIVIPANVGECRTSWTVADPVTGKTHVRLTNGAGCEEAGIKVVKDFLGTTTHEVETVKAHVGEWSVPIFPRDERLILVYIADSTGNEYSYPRWTYLSDKDGSYVFDAATLHRLTLPDGLVVPADRDGTIPVKRLVNVLRSRDTP